MCMFVSKWDYLVNYKGAFCDFLQFGIFTGWPKSFLCWKDCICNYFVSLQSNQIVYCAERTVSLIILYFYRVTEEFIYKKRQSSRLFPIFTGWPKSLWTWTDCPWYAELTNLSRKKDLEFSPFFTLNLNLYLIFEPAIINVIISTFVFMPLDFSNPRTNFFWSRILFNQDNF